MTASRIQTAVERIEAALSRIDKAAESLARPSASPDEETRRVIDDALRDLDTLIERLEA